MSIDTTADELLTDLHVIAMIPERGRLCIRNGRLSVETNPNGNGVSNIPSNVVLAMRRWWHQDNRTTALTHLGTTLTRSFALTIELHNDREKYNWLIGQFKYAFTHAITGLKNMSLTYNDDANTRARLLVTIDRLTDATAKLDSVDLISDNV